MSPGVVMLALVVASCGTDAPSSSSTASEPGEVTDVPPASRVVRAFCGSPDEARIRAAHPELPACFNRAYVYVEARVGGHDLLVLGHDADPCCSDVPSPATSLGAHVYVDGVERPAFDPLALPAPPRDATEATALLSAELLRLYVVHPSLDASDARALRTAWPAAARAIDANPPSLRRTDRGWVLRALGDSSEHERGVSCRSLAVWEAEVDTGPVRARRVAHYSEGRVQGQPCEGQPLP